MYWMNCCYSSGTHVPSSHWHVTLHHGHKPMGRWDMLPNTWVVLTLGPSRPCNIWLWPRNWGWWGTSSQPIVDPLIAFPNAHYKIFTKLLQLKLALIANLHQLQTCTNCRGSDVLEPDNIHPWMLKIHWSKSEAWWISPDTMPPSIDLLGWTWIDQDALGMFLGFTFSNTIHLHITDVALS